VALAHRFAEKCPDRPLWLAGHVVSVGDARADTEAAEQACADVDTVRGDGIALDRWIWEPAIDGYEGAAGFDAGLGLFDRNRHAKAAAGVVQQWSEARRATQGAAAEAAVIESDDADDSGNPRPN